MKRLALICLLLAGCTPYIMTPMPRPTRMWPKIAPPTAVDAPLLPTVTPTPIPIYYGYGRID